MSSTSHSPSASEIPGSVRREFRRLATINVVSNVTVPLAGLADTAMLGRLPGAVDLAGVALASLFFDLLYFGLGFLRMGTTGPVARAHGRRDTLEQNGILLRGLALALGIGLVVVALRHPLADLTFGLLSGTADVESAGRAYFLARIWAAPATLANLVVIGWLLGRSQSGRALAVTVVQNLVNVVMNAWFILYLGYGAQGAGLATAIGQYCGALVALVLVSRQVQRIGRAGLRDGKAWRAMLGLNRDIFVRTLCLLAAFTLFTDFSARQGTVVLAANAVLLRVVSLGSYWIDGLAYATETIVGRLSGAGDHAHATATLGWALRLGLVSAAVVALPTALFPGTLLHWMLGSSAVRQAVSAFAPWLVPVLVVGAVAYVLDGYFLGLSAGAVLRNSMLTSLALFLVPALVAVRLESPHLLWSALAILMLARAGTLARRVHRT